MAFSFAHWQKPGSIEKKQMDPLLISIFSTKVGQLSSIFNVKNVH